jgi:hypothetical protein
LMFETFGAPDDGKPAIELLMESQIKKLVRTRKPSAKTRQSLIAKKCEVTVAVWG